MQQTGTVAKYEVKFQHNCNKIPRLPESFLKGYYIEGLRYDIQCEVIGAQPYNLQHAIGLSKLYEGKLGHGKPPNLQPRMHHTTSILGPRPFSASYTNTTARQAIVPYTTPTNTVKNPEPVSQVTHYHKSPIKRLTQAERQQKIDKGLCYNCDETWHKGHKCKSQMSLLLLEGVIPEGCESIDQCDFGEATTESIEEITGGESNSRSLYALIGNPNTRCLRLQGCIQGKVLQILIDGGSSHNFIQIRVANYLGLDITPSPQF